MILLAGLLMWSTMANTVPTSKAIGQDADDAYTHCEGTVHADCTEEVCTPGCKHQVNDLLLLQTSMELSHLSKDTNVATTEPMSTTVMDSAAEVTGVTLNAAGDLDAFISAVVMNAVMWLAFVAFASKLRLWYPQIYSHNETLEKAPRVKAEQTFLGWVHASLQNDTADRIPVIGLDNAMLLEFCNLCMKILGTIGVPMVCIMCPLHLIFGGDRAGDDHLSAIAMGNVVDDHPWLYYCHACIVWYVVLVCHKYIYAAQERFLRWRFDWLKQMSAPRATTVMVEGIPDEYQSDEKLREFFAAAFSKDRIKDAFVVKHAEQLEYMIREKDNLRFKKMEAETKWNKDGKPHNERPMIKVDRNSEPQDALDYYESQIREKNDEIVKERARIKKETVQVGGLNTKTGFVTFTHQREKEITQNLKFSADHDVWAVSVPPEPSDIRWADLKVRDEFKVLNAVIGYACVIGVYVGFMPICIFVTNLANSFNMGPFQPLWMAFAPTMGLLLFLSFLPTVLILVFHFFFSLKADAYAQHKLQVWYFWFQVFFVILVTAIGTSLLDFLADISKSPFIIFKILADQLPWATHFYMNYLVLQCFTHAMNFTRYVVLSKFIAFKTIWDVDQARQMSEPEDQDYYGIGSRSARFTINMLIGIVFSTLSPLCALLAFTNFAICRLLYGYMIVYAETPKADLGGDFWVTKLKHVQFGCILYCVLMIGVLNFRAATWGPLIIAIPALFFAIWSRDRFDHAFAWEDLPFSEIALDKTGQIDKEIDTTQSYEQPELREDR